MTGLEEAILEVLREREKLTRRQISWAVTEKKEFLTTTRDEIQGAIAKLNKRGEIIFVQMYGLGWYEIKG